MPGVETISYNATPLAYVVRSAARESSTSFFTGDDAAFQAGFVVQQAGGSVIPHIHLPVIRTVVGTSELLMVRQGRCVVDIYSDDRVLVASREMGPGDIVISVGGGHGFRMIEDTVLFEVKQGPYGGQDEKERFTPRGNSGED